MRRVFLAVGAALVMAAGCKSGPSLVGSWNAAGGDLAQTPGASVVMTYDANNVTMLVTMENPQFGSFSVTAKGSYKLEGDKYAHNITDVQVDTSKVNAAAKAIIDGQLKKETILEQMNKNNAMTAKFNEDGSVTLSGSNKTTLTLTKKQ